MTSAAGSLGRCAVPCIWPEPRALCLPDPKALCLPDPKALCRRHNLRLKKSLGQHLVADPSIIAKTIALSQLSPGDRVLEVGPGLGALTLGLAQAQAQVLAVEIDQNLKPALTEVLGEHLSEHLAPGRVKLIWQDVMDGGWQELLEPANNWKLVANLPYNIATRFILDALQNVPAISEMVVMVQLEVAQRLAAEAGGGDYGIASVKLAYWADASLLETVPAAAFFPAPKVDSALVRIVRHARQYPVGWQDPDDRRVLFDLVDRAFRQRRKMLRNSLRQVVSPEMFEQAGVVSTDRPALLSLGDWVRLAVCVGGGADQPEPNQPEHR